MFDATLDATAATAAEDPFADLRQTAPGEVNPFADLESPSGTPESTAAAREPQLIGGGTADAPAYQIVNGKFSHVPIGVPAAAQDYGPFSDLVRSGPAIHAPTNYAEQFGPFGDLVPSPTPESEKAVRGTPITLDQANALEGMYEAQNAIGLLTQPLRENWQPEPTGKLPAGEHVPSAGEQDVQGAIAASGSAFKDLPIVPEAAVRLSRQLNPLLAGPQVIGAVFPQLKTAIEGLSRAGDQTVASLTTPANLLIIGGLALAPQFGVPAIISRAVSLGFGIQAAHGMGEEINAAIESKENPEEFWRHIGLAAGQGAIATAATIHGVSSGEPPAGAPPKPPQVSIPLERFKIEGQNASEISSATRLGEQPGGPESLGSGGSQGVERVQQGTEAAQASAPASGETTTQEPTGVNIPQSVHDLRPALLTDTGVLEGEKGQTHDQIINAQPDPTELKASDPEHGFVNVNAPNDFINRDKAAAAVGETDPLDSERLIQLQNEIPQPVEGGGESPKAVGGAELPAAPSEQPPAPEVAPQFTPAPEVKAILEKAKPNVPQRSLTAPDVNVKLGDGQVQVRTTAEEIGKILPELPSELHQEMARVAQLEPGAAKENELSKLRARLSQEGEAGQRALSYLQRPEFSDAPSGLRPTAAGDVAVPGASSGAPQDGGIAPPETRPEGGALFGAGGKRLRTVPVGRTPLGDKNWLRVPKWWARAGRGLFLEGTRNTLGRVKNKVGQALAKATRQHVDIEQELFGQNETILRKAFDAVPRARRDAAVVEASQFFRDKESGRPTTPLQPDAQGLVDAWFKVGKDTGDIARANNVQVWDKLGKYRPMGTVKDYVPRMFKGEVEKVLRDPQSDPKLFNQLASDLATHRGITPEEAAAELRGVSGRFSANDHMGNLELARTEQLPESFYEYDLRNLAARYLGAFSERMAQIIAYGQRLGPREAPTQQNLWDVARHEAQDVDTQQWLNDAEDQATGFHPKSPINRNLRRAQALGNAMLLSDPTTTVMRNLLSGLATTTERFGVGRSLRQMVAAGRSVSRMDARQIGVTRSDIGAFLGAEELGDSKLDTWIRELQSKALTISGFTGSETYVRTHNALVASQFARDAAKALATNPKSALAREALAHFKRLDVDPEKVLSENGEWRTGPETRKFIRSTVRESQGGYRFDQVPLWAGSSVGRFLYQYGRWSIQRAGDIMRNTIRPALGETVEFRGQQMTRRNVMPLVRLGLSVVGLGEIFSGIAVGLFGRDRRDASFTEIAQAFTEDESKAVALLGERMVNDIIMAGTLGLLSQPLDFIKATKDQSRFKNPLEPPSLAGVKTVMQLAQQAWDQGGTLTKRDWLDAASSVTRGPKNVVDISRHAAGARLYESQNDQRTLRNAAKRWGKEQGLDISQQTGFGDFRKSPKAPVFESINDALLSGNAAAAHKIASDYIRSSPDKQKAKTSVLASVEAKHPFRAGPFTADKYRDLFLAWAKKNLGADDQQQIVRVIKLYNRTAKDAGLTQ